MNLEEFTKAIQILTETFPIPNMEKRIGSLHYFFNKISDKAIAEAAKKIAREGDRFPTPSMFGQYIDQVTEAPSIKQKQACNWCDGFGWVSIQDSKGYWDAYRSRCHHSQGLSEKIPLASSSFRTETAGK